MDKNFRADCLICGQPLVYLDKVRNSACVLCGREFSSQVSCADGHYVCDACHAAPAGELIETLCLHSNSVKPLDLAIELMKSPVVHMHGPEHHFLVPAVLLTAYYNQRSQPEEKAQKLRLARQRAEQVLGGFCGFYGACGAGIGTGLFVSLITNSTPLSRETWGLANRMTSHSLGCIGALGGPRCCKRDTFMALKAAKGFMKSQLSIPLDIPDVITCEFSANNRECLEAACPFHARERIE